MIQKLLSKLEQAFKEKNIKEAKRTIAKIDKRPQVPEVYLDISKFAMQAKEWDIMKEYFPRACKARPELALQVTLWLDHEPIFTAVSQSLSMLDLADQYLPSNILLYSARGAVLNRAERFDESIAIFEEIFQSADQSRNLQSLLGLGEAYFKTNRYHDAIGAGLLALEISPAHAEVNFQIGLCYVAIENLSEGVKYLSKVLEINSSHIGAHINLAQIMLKIGMFDEGWQHHEWRFDESMKNVANFKLPFPRWHNENINGKHVFIWVDQGLGDQVMYGSMINKLLARGAKVSVIAERRLKDIFERSFAIEGFFGFDKTGIKDVENSGKTYDYHCPFGTLPAFFIRCFEDFGVLKPYLKPNPELVEKYTQELQSQFPNKKLIGFGWRGGIAATRNHARLVDLSLWKNMFKLENCQFVNFQYDATPEERVLLAEDDVYTPDIDLKFDIDAVLAYMAAMDLYITADNTNAHFAGAIGLPVWNLIPVAAEWRWFLDRDESLWYPCMRLFRNAELDSWDNCMASVNQELLQWSTSKE